MNYHDPVLLKEAILGLNIVADGIYADATFGGGGHSKEILKHLKNGRLIAFDTDDDAKQNTIHDERFTLLIQNFRFFKNNLRFHNALPLNGILADLGVSSHQFDVAERGFSFRYEAELDMRMNSRGGASAADVINTYTADRLSNVFRNYGEIMNAGRLAQAIIYRRAQKTITTTWELKEIVQEFATQRVVAHKGKNKKKQNQYMAQVFQALRIEVNEELDALKAFLEQCAEALVPGGRLAVITYHSLEDRIVKNFIRAGNPEGIEKKDLMGNIQKPFNAVNAKVIVPGEEEIFRNPRARSAKLRIAEKISMKEAGGSYIKTK